MVGSTSASDSSFTYAQGYVISAKYELELLLGEGGMGAVWRARNMALDSPVAIKLIRADLNRDAMSTRLLQEARAAAKLGHPAIVRVFDVGQTEHGDPFIVMELLRGESLGALLLAKGRIPATRAVQLLLPIADALAVAHGKRIVHRDLKPDNVFISNNEGEIQPKLVDFGIAKLEQRDGASLLTQAGVVLGSPEYMSPEQARGQGDLDLRTDVWSFCVVLYEIITGEIPFTGPNYNAIIRAIVETEPPKLTELAAGDAALSAIVARGMSKDRADRYDSMVQLGKALANWLVDQGITEDVTGVSLETKWLGRSTDPPSRAASRRSIPDSDLAPVSSLRGPSSGGNRVVTVGNSEPPDTSRAVSSSVPAAPERPRRALGYAALGAVALVAGITLALLGKSGEKSAAQPLPDSAHQRVVADQRPSPTAAEPVPSAPATVAEAASAAASSAPPASSATTKVIRPHPPTRAPAAGDPRKAQGAKVDRGGSDLLAPY